MAQVVPFRVSDGSLVLVSIDDEDGVVRAGTRPGGAITDAVASISDALVPIRLAADDAIRSLRDLPSSPARIEVEFGVCLTGEASAVIAKVGVEAQMKLTVVWERGE